jgi:hypothetical protein
MQVNNSMEEEEEERHVSSFSHDSAERAEGVQPILSSAIPAPFGRRDSSSSVKSLRSYHTVRESLGKMHAYVERVSKLDMTQIMTMPVNTNGNASAGLSKHSIVTPLSEEVVADQVTGTQHALNLSLEKAAAHLNRSHQQLIECISEDDSENEFSCI